MRILFRRDVNYICKRLSAIQYLITHDAKVDPIVLEKIVDGLLEVGELACGTNSVDKILRYTDWLERNILVDSEVQG